MSGTEKDDFDDISDALKDLGADDIVAGINLSKPRATPLKGPDPFSREAGFVESCPACKGSGRFRSWSGRDCGKCFKCDGQGKRTFKTAPESRAQARVNRRNKADAARADWLNEHKAEMAWLKETAERVARKGQSFDFPAKLIAAVNEWGSLTDGQLSKVRALMQRDAERAADREARGMRPVATVDAREIEAAFAKARESAARPGMQGIWVKPLTLRARDLDLTFQPGSIGSRWEGEIFVKAGEKKLGSIKGGEFRQRFECSDADKLAVIEACSDPSKAAKAFGKAWGVCSVCHRTLTNDESIALGIGPICAEKFGF
jgi:hypothetical protein